jgi:hypothetical protein
MPFFIVFVSAFINHFARSAVQPHELIEKKLLFMRAHCLVVIHQRPEIFGLVGFQFEELNEPVYKSRGNSGPGLDHVIEIALGVCLAKPVAYIRMGKSGVLGLSFGIIILQIFPEIYILENDRQYGFHTVNNTKSTAQ